MVFSCKAIDVLLSAGMSTPALRDIAREGVDIQRTAYSGVASSALVKTKQDSTGSTQDGENIG